MIHAGCKHGSCVRAVPGAAGEIEGRAASAFGRQRSGNREASQPRCFRLLGERRRREEPLAGGQPTGPAFPVRQSGNSRAQKRSKLILHVYARAGRNRKPGRDRDVVLCEHARSRVAVRKTRNVARTVVLALESQSRDPVVAAGGAVKAQLAEQHVMLIAFADLAEAVIVILSRGREPSREHVTVADRHAVIAADVVATRVESLAVRLAYGRKHGAFHSAALAIFVGDAASEKGRLPVASVPEESRTDD